MRLEGAARACEITQASESSVFSKVSYHLMDEGTCIFPHTGRLPDVVFHENLFL